jgi:hypothetical protein
MVLWHCPVLSSAGQLTPNLLMNEISFQRAGVDTVEQESQDMVIIFRIVGFSKGGWWMMWVT